MLNWRLKRRIKTLLENNLFKLEKENETDSGFNLIISFGKELQLSSFYVDRNKKYSGLTIGTYITLRRQSVSERMMSKIRTLAAKTSAVLSSSLNEDDTITFSIYVVFDPPKFYEDEFIDCIFSFKKTVKLLYDEINSFLSNKEPFYLDLSMFEGVDWAVFDPYPYIAERDKNFDGSWGIYIDTLQNANDKATELAYVKMCKIFEEKNNIAIELVCDYIIDSVMQYVVKNKEKSKS